MNISCLKPKQKLKQKNFNSFSNQPLHTDKKTDVAKAFNCNEKTPTHTIFIKTEITQWNKPVSANSVSIGQLVKSALQSEIKEAFKMHFV